MDGSVHAIPKKEWKKGGVVASQERAMEQIDPRKIRQPEEQTEQGQGPGNIPHCQGLGRTKIDPLIKDIDGQPRYTHDEIRDIIAKQIESDKPKEWSNIEVDKTVDIQELRDGLNTLPANTAGGYDGISYPFLRFWMKHQEQHMVETTNHLIRFGERKWHEARTVLIQKAGKDDYHMAKRRG